MAKDVYKVNRGINKSIEFKGLKAQYIWWLAIGIVTTLILFAILYIIGLHTYLCIGFAIASFSSVVIKTYQLSKRYGEHGMMKEKARRLVPKAIRSRSRKPFIRQPNN